MRAPPLSAIVIVLVGACRFGEHHAEPPVDGALSHGTIDAAGGDAAPDADQNVFHGLHATIGEQPVGTGTCKSLAGYTMMMDRFDPPVMDQDVVAGWDFDTGADSYNDPSYGFEPNWPSAKWGNFSVRFRGSVKLAAGTHCFSIDIGATGTDIFTSTNGCGQIYVGDAQGAAIAETGFEAATAGPATGCVTLTTDAAPELDIVFWYFNILEQAILHVTVDGSPLDLTSLSAPSP